MNLQSVRMTNYILKMKRSKCTNFLRMEVSRFQEELPYEIIYNHSKIKKKLIRKESFNKRILQF